MRLLGVCAAVLGLFGTIGISSAVLAQQKSYTYDTPMSEVEADCARDISDACLSAYVRYQDGRGVPADPKKAQKYMLRSCDTGKAIACATYATLLEKGEAGKTAGGRQMVLRYADRACTLGNNQGCEQAKRVRGAQATPTPRTAVAAAPRPAATRPASTGNPLLDECNAGRRASCANYANVLGKQGDNAGALKYSQKACDMGEQAGCLNAKTYANRGAVATPTASSNARLKADCNAGSRQACDGYAYVMAQAKNWPEASLYANKSCSMGSNWACENRGSYSSAAGRVGDQSEEGKQHRRDAQIQNARRTGFYAGPIIAQLNGERHVETLGILIRDGGAKGLQSLNMAELEDLAMNFPSSETAAYAIVQSEWQRRGGPQMLATREAERKAWAEEQQARQAENAVPAGRRSNYRPATGAPVGSAGNGSAAPRQQTCTETYLSGPNGGRVVRCR